MGAPTVFPKLRGGDVSAEQARAQDNVDTVLRPMAQALSQTPIMGVAPVWTAPNLLNGYTNFNAAGGGFAISGFYKDSLFRVWSKGTLLNSTGAPLGTGVAAFQFPLGFRPSERQRLTVVGDGATFQFVQVDTDGFVYPGVAVPGPGSLDLFFSFLAER